MQLTKFPNAPSRQPIAISVISVSTSLAILSVALRVWVRLSRTKRPIWLDDWTIIFAAVLTTISMVINFYQLRYGLGFHIYDLSPEILSHASLSVKFTYITQIIYFVIIGLTRLSILLFLYTFLKPLRQLVTALCVILCTFHVICIFLAIFQCLPVSAIFNTSQHSVPGHCIDRTSFYYAAAGLNIFFDVVIYVLPMRTLWKVNLPRKVRIALLGVFTVGTFVVITGCVRIRSLRTASVTDDPTWDNVDVMSWSILETNVGIICACLPCLKPLFLMKKKDASSDNSDGCAHSARQLYRPGSHGNEYNGCTGASVSATASRASPTRMMESLPEEDIEGREADMRRTRAVVGSKPIVVTSEFEITVTELQGNENGSEKV